MSADPFIFYKPKMPVAPAEPVVAVTQLIDSALDNRPEVKINMYNINYNRTNVALQRANAVPDLTFRRYL